jgi:hypothetical protein
MAGWAERRKEKMAIAKVVKKFQIEAQPKESEEWQRRSYQERLSALEEIRQEYHRWKLNAQSGLQRVYSVVKH